LVTADVECCLVGMYSMYDPCMISNLEKSPWRIATPSILLFPRDHLVRLFQGSDSHVPFRLASSKASGVAGWDRESYLQSRQRRFLHL
jgi:hypothetical protein